MSSAASPASRSVAEKPSDSLVIQSIRVIAINCVLAHCLDKLLSFFVWKETEFIKFPNEAMLKASFELDAVEFRRHAKFRSVELDTGAILTAPSEDFDKVFQREQLSSDRVRYTAVGRVIDEKVIKGRV